MQTRTATRAWFFSPSLNASRLQRRCIYASVCGIGSVAKIRGEELRKTEQVRYLRSTLEYLRGPRVAARLSSKWDPRAVCQSRVSQPPHFAGFDAPTRVLGMALASTNEPRKIRKGVLFLRLQHRRRIRGAIYRGTPDEPIHVLPPYNHHLHIADAWSRVGAAKYKVHMQKAKLNKT